MDKRRRSKLDRLQEGQDARRRNESKEKFWLEHAEWRRKQYDAKVEKMNAFNTGGSGNQGMYYATSAPTITTSLTFNNNPILDIQGHGFQYDVQAQQYVSVEDNRIKLSPQHVAELQSGAAVLDWEDMKLRYLANVAAGQEYPRGWADVDKVKKDTPNSDWLMKEIGRVCTVGRKALAAA